MLSHYYRYRLKVLLMGLGYVAAFYGIHLCFAAWRREGETPYCRECGQNLTGVESGRCPECGHKYLSYGVRRGEKVFSPLRFAAGLALGLGGAAWVAFSFLHRW